MDYSDVDFKSLMCSDNDYVEHYLSFFVDDRFKTPYGKFILSFFTGNYEHMRENIIEGVDDETLEYEKDLCDEDVKFLTNTQMYKDMINFFVLIREDGNSASHEVADPDLTRDLINFHFSGHNTSMTHHIELYRGQPNTHGIAFPSMRVYAHNKPEEVFYAIPPNIMMKKFCVSSWSITDYFFSGDQLKCILVRGDNIVKNFHDLFKDKVLFATRQKLDVILTWEEWVFLTTKGKKTLDERSYIDDMILFFIFRKVEKMTKLLDSNLESVREMYRILPSDFVERKTIQNHHYSVDDIVAPFLLSPSDSVLIGYQTENGYLARHPTDEERMAIDIFLRHTEQTCQLPIAGELFTFHKGFANDYSRKLDKVPYFYFEIGDKTFDIIIEEIYSSILMSKDKKIYASKQELIDGQFELYSLDNSRLEKFRWYMSDSEKLQDFLSEVLFIEDWERGHPNGPHMACTSMEVCDLFRERKVRVIDINFDEEMEDE